MKKIAIVRFAVSFGGIENQIIKLVSKMNKSYEFVLVTNEKSDFSDEFEKYGKVFFLGTKKIFKAKRMICKIINEESIDVIQSHMLRESFICCLCRRSIKKIKHFFRVHTYIDCSFISRYKKNIYHIVSKFLSRYVDLYLPINNSNYLELINRSKIKKNKIIIIHDGIDRIDALSKSDYNYYDIIMIANLIYGKGHDVAIRALAELVKVDKRYNICFVGHTNIESDDSEYSLKNITNLAKELDVINNIHFVGYIKNISSVLKNISIVILPSYSEGTPNCLLEAMSAKKIVVASSVGGIPEFLIDNVNGFLHENHNYEELSEKILSIKRFTKTEIAAICENGYRTWEKEYSLDNMIMEFEKIYNEV